MHRAAARRQSRARRDRKSFGSLLARWTDLIAQQMRAVIVSHGHAQVVGIVPLLLCAPRFLDGSITLGQMMQLASAFAIVQSELAGRQLSAHCGMDGVRVPCRGLLAAIDGVEKLERARPPRIFAQGEAAALSLHGLSVHLNDGVPLVDAIHARVELGERVLLVGDSGTGKSALVRALAGVWPWSHGHVAQPQSAEICVIPRRAVCPGGFVAPRHYIPTAARMRGATSRCGRTEGGGAWPFSAQARR